MKAVFKSDFSEYDPVSLFHGHRIGYVIMLSLNLALPSTASLEAIQDIEFSGFDDLSAAQTHFPNKRTFSQVEASIVTSKPG